MLQTLLTVAAGLNLTVSELLSGLEAQAKKSDSATQRLPGARRDTPVVEVM